MAKYDYLNNYLNSNMNTYKSGGMFTSYNVGGTHEQNPNGGIPLGEDAVVEQGETSVNLDQDGAPTEKPTGSKYIFSDRQVWTPEEMKMAGLPPTRKPVTAGEYMAKLNEKFSGRAGSKADKETLNTFTKRATELAEQKRMKQEQLERAMQLNSQEVAPENTEVPDGMEEFQEQPQQFYNGGEYSRYFNQAANAIDTSAITAPSMSTSLGTSGADTATAGATSGSLGNAGGYIQAAGTAFDMYQTAKTGNTSTNRGKAIGGGAAKGALAGASAGTTFMPGIGTVVGGAIGAIAGGVSGYFGSEKARKNESDDIRKATAQVNAGMPNSAAWTGVGGGVVSAMGGYITSKPASYAGGGLTGKDRGSDKKPYPMVSSSDFAGGNRSYPIPTRADAVDALRLAGLHGRSDVRAKVFSKYPDLKKENGGPVRPPDVRRPNDQLVLPPIKDLRQTIPRYIPTSSDVNSAKRNAAIAAIADPNVREGTKDFASWYSNPETLRRFQKNTGFDNRRLKDLVDYGVNVPARQASKSYPLLGADSQAEFQGYNNVPKEQIIYEPGVDRGVIGHERVHASGVDTVLGPALKRVLGDPSQQKTKNTLNAVKRYMKTPEESYGNFQQFRLKLGLKPGEKIKDVKSLKARAKATGADLENFYQTYDDDKIMKAINTIAQTGVPNDRIYAAHGGMIRYDNGGPRPAWFDDIYPEGLQGTLSDNQVTQSLANMYNTGMNFPLNAKFGNNEYPIGPIPKGATFANQGLTPGGREYLTPASVITPRSGYSPTSTAKIQTPYTATERPSTMSTIGKYAGQVGNWLDENKNSLLRAYPILSNILERDKIRKPIGHYGARLNDAYNVPVPDEAAALRDINAAYNNKVRALGQMGGSQGQQRAALLGLGAQENQLRSQTYAGLEEARMQRAMAEQQFKNQIAQYNAAKSDQDRDLMDRDIAKYDELRSKFTSQIAGDIGQIGLEQDRMDQVANMYGYTRKGKYLVNNTTGKIATPEEISKIKASMAKKEETKTAAFGGYITRKPSKY